MTPRETLQALSAPLPPDAISWRLGTMNADKTKGMALAYLDARDVMRRLDEVMGADWQCEYVPMPNGTCCCRIGLLIDGQWRWRSNGAINLSDSQKTDAKEMAEKGSYSDAFKRAAVLWGVGTYLYDLGATWVTVEARGNSFVIPAGELSRLAGILRRGSPVSAHTAPTAPSQEDRAIAAKVAAEMPAHKSAPDPKIAALNRPKPQSTPRGPSVRDSASVRSLILLSLEACKTRDHMLDWWADNGKQSDKWSLMLPADHDAILKAAADKSASLTAEEAGADPETGEIAA